MMLKIRFERLDGNISTKLKITISPEDNVEIEIYHLKIMEKKMKH